MAGRIGFVQNAAGAVPGPFDCFLVLRGVKTLAVRMERHCANAARVAEALQGHPGVARVFYPGLVDHPGHELAAAQMRGFGGMVSFTLAGGESDGARRRLDDIDLLTRPSRSGAVESLIEHPHRMTHASVAGTALSVDPALLRLSIGLEDVSDLVADLHQALDRVGTATH